MTRAVLAALVSLTLAGPVRAQDTADDAKKAAALEEARQHVAKAKVHYDLGEFKEAADEYIIVYRLRPIPAILFNVAQSYRQAGMYEKARQFYKSYLRESPEAKNRAMIEQSIKEMNDLLAKEKRTKESAPVGVKQPPDASLPIADAKKPELSKPDAKPADKAAVAAQKPQEQKPGGAAEVGTAHASSDKGKTNVVAPPASGTVVALVPGAAVASGQNSSARSATPAGATGTTPRAASVPPAGRPLSGVGASSTQLSPQRDRTWAWVTAGASALALGGGAAFGYKTINGAAPSDARTANIMYGAGAALAIASAALFVFEF